MHRLSLGTKFGYGIADFGVSTGLLAVSLYLFDYYVDGIGMSPLLVGIAFAVAMVWDAVSDPLLGRICDRSRTPWGRFLPFMMAGSVVLPFSLWLIFQPPSGASDLVLFLFLVFSYGLLTTGMTLVGVPHLALSGVLSSSSSERSALLAWRLVFGTLGLGFALAAPLVVAELKSLDLDTASGRVETRQIASGWFAIATAVTIAITLGAIWRKALYSSMKERTLVSRSVWEELKEVIQNPLFRPLFLSFVFISVGRSVNTVLALLYYRESLRLNEKEILGPVLGLFTLCIILSPLLWSPLAARFGKKWPAFGGLLILGLLTSIAYPLFPVGSLSGPIGAAVIGGVAVGAIFLFESMVTDAVDADALEGKGRREGLYFGLWRMGQKLANSFGILLASFLLIGIGFDESLSEQGTDVQRRLAWVFGPGVGLFFLLGVATFVKSPLSPKRERELQTALNEDNGISNV